MLAANNPDNCPLRPWLAVPANNKCSTDNDMAQIYSLFISRIDTLDV